MASKNLQKSSAIQNNSVTLSSVIIAIIVCETFDLHYKVTTIFANHQIFRQLYFVELTIFYINRKKFYKFLQISKIFMNFVTK